MRQQGSGATVNCSSLGGIVGGNGHAAVHQPRLLAEHLHCERAVGARARPSRVPPTSSAPPMSARRWPAPKHTAWATRPRPSGPRRSFMSGCDPTAKATGGVLPRRPGDCCALAWHSRPPPPPDRAHVVELSLTDQLKANRSRRATQTGRPPSATITGEPARVPAPLLSHPGTVSGRPTPTPEASLGAHEST